MDVLELGSVRESEHLSRAVSAGLRSRPPQLADPLFAESLGGLCFPFLNGLWELEMEAYSGVASQGVAILEAARGWAPENLLSAAKAIFSPTVGLAREWHGLVGGDVVVASGDLRESVRFLSQQGVSSQDLAWSGSPLNRIDRKSFPYFLRYLAPLVGPGHCLWLGGCVGGPGALRARVEASLPELLDKAQAVVDQALVGAQVARLGVREDAGESRLALHAELSGASLEGVPLNGVDLAYYRSAIEDDAMEAFGFAGLEVGDRAEAPSGHAVWGLRRAK